MEELATNKKLHQSQIIPLSAPQDHAATLSLSPFGRDLTIAGRNGIWLVDLEPQDSLNNSNSSSFQLFNTSRYISPASEGYARQNFAGVRCEWHTFRSHVEYIAASIDRDIVIWNIKQLQSSSGAPDSWTPWTAYEAHSRCITSIEWSLSDPNILGSASMDSFVNLWDLRALKSKPAQTLQDPSFVAASKISWNRKNEFILASSHDRTAFVWDVRHGVRPLLEIQALDYIDSIDWSHVGENELLVHGYGKSIDVWDIGKAQIIRQTSEPDLFSHKTRFTPFGSGVVFAPMLLECNSTKYSDKHVVFRNGHTLDNTVYSVDLKSNTVDVTEFAWRVSRGNLEQDFDDRIFKLLTWGTDHRLREITFDSSLFQVLGHRQENSTAGDRLTLASSEADKMKSGPSNSADVLRSVFKQLRKADEDRKAAEIFANDKFHHQRLRKKHRSKPIHTKSLLSRLPATPPRQSNEDIVDYDERVDYFGKSVYGKMEERLFIDSRPKGFWFCGDLLVSIKVNQGVSTPRIPNVTEQRFVNSRNYDIVDGPVPSIEIIVQSVSNLLPYPVFHDLPDSPLSNKNASFEDKLFANIDLLISQFKPGDSLTSTTEIAWQLCKFIINVCNTDTLDFAQIRKLWNGHPLGVKLLHHLTTVLAREDNFSMYAILSILVQKLQMATKDEENIPEFTAIFSKLPADEPKKPSAPIHKRPRLPMPKYVPRYLRHKMTLRSYSNSTAQLKPEKNTFPLKNTDAVDPTIFAGSLRQFQDILQRQSAFQLVTELNKCIQSISATPPITTHQGPHQNIICKICGALAKDSSGILCRKCHRFSNECSVCGLVIRNVATYCQQCGHGGHLKHIKSWFSEMGNVECPTGCGCLCELFDILGN